MASMAALDCFLLMTIMGVTTFAAVLKPLKNHKVLLVSMDGFRYDYLSRVSTPNFDEMIESGVTVPYINNTYVTNTFPSHYSIVTGRYEESHGIVGNYMYDPEFDSHFSMSTTVDTKWWDEAEPLWTNALHSGLKVGVLSWPGSEAFSDEGKHPTKWKRYGADISFEQRVETVVNWLSNDDFDLCLLYFNEPDNSGHLYGPDDPRLRLVIKQMDSVLGFIRKRLREKELTDVVNLIVTSDHGMTTVDPETKVINLNDYVNDSLLLEVVDDEAFAQIRPQPGKAEALVHALSGIQHMQVMLKEDIPDRFHFKNNDRVMPVFAIAEEGWEITGNLTRLRQWKHRGNHGYDNSLMNMKPIFLASGPDFRFGFKGVPFKSVDIYPLICHLLKLEPATNNGSLEQVSALLNGSANMATSTISFSIITCFHSLRLTINLLF